MGLSIQEKKANKLSIKILEFKIMGDERGSLIALEEDFNVPFSIKRVYYIFDTKKNVTRGKHAHRKLKQVLVATSGSCDILLDNGYEQKTVRLDSPTKGLYVDSPIWREMSNFSDDCVLMVVANCLYDTSDYIRDYDEFLKSVGKK